MNTNVDTPSPAEGIQDAVVVPSVFTTLIDSIEGNRAVAEKLTGVDRTDDAMLFDGFVADRRRFTDEIRAFAAVRGIEVDDQGSTLASLHRVWISLKDTLTGTDSDAVIRAAVTGAKYAEGQLTQALDENISPELRTLLTDQRDAIRTTVRQMEQRVMSTT
ncbi:MAG: DUF2383 domain-containing protein [Actinomycetota bacterium]